MHVERVPRQGSAVELDAALLEQPPGLRGGDAERLRQEQREKALAEAANITKNAEAQIQRETAKAIEQIRRETVDLSVAIAEKLIRRQVTAADQDALLNEAVSEISQTRH